MRVRTEVVMAKRLYPDGEWSDDADRLVRKATDLVKAFLAEAEEDGEVDLRDFHYLFNDAVSQVVLHEIVPRRLR